MYLICKHDYYVFNIKSNSLLSLSLQTSVSCLAQTEDLGTAVGVGCNMVQLSISGMLRLCTFGFDAGYKQGFLRAPCLGFYRAMLPKQNK